LRLCVVVCCSCFVATVFGATPPTWPDAYSVDMKIQSIVVHPDYYVNWSGYSNIGIPALTLDYPERGLSQIIDFSSKQSQTTAYYDGGSTCYAYGLDVDPEEVTDFGLLIVFGAYGVSWESETYSATLDGKSCTVYTGHGWSAPDISAPTITVKYAVLASDHSVPVQWNNTIDVYGLVEAIKYDMTKGSPPDSHFSLSDNCDFYGPHYKINDAELNQPVISPSLVEKINSNPNSTWKAKLHPKFEKMTLREAMNLNKQQPGVSSIKKRRSVRQDLPTSFDHTEMYPKCPHSIRDQGACGSCFAHAVIEAIEDRMCQMSDESWTSTLSVQHVVSCDYVDWGCKGGNVDTAWKFIKENGVVYESCVSYASTYGVNPACPTTCDDKTELKRPELSLGDIYHLATVEEIQSEIYENGPVSAIMVIMQDIYSYESGIYQYTTGDLAGSHLVKIVGWGVENDTPYWKIANSWGTSWGEDGYFRVKRGTNEVGIEAGVFGAELVSYPHSDSSASYPHSDSSDSYPHSDSSDSYPHSDSSDSYPHSDSSDSYPHSASLVSYPQSSNTAQIFPLFALLLVCISVTLRI